jgi:two-component system LytT family response regulator
MIRVFLVEDEPPALRKLERMVAEESDLEVCGAASTVSEAIAGITGAHPNLVFLDIRLPDGTGFEILQALDDIPDQPSLQIVFLTAYDDYALEAFKVAALDYLLKPVSRERFSVAVERARERLKTQMRAPEQHYTRRFLVERRKAAYFLPVDSVRHIVADRNYALLHSDLGEFAIRATIEGLQKRLDPAEFARVSRSAIVRVAAIKEVRLSVDSNCILVMRSGEEIGCSKKYWTNALEKLL